MNKYTLLNNIGLQTRRTNNLNSIGVMLMKSKDVLDYTRYVTNIESVHRLYREVGEREYYIKATAAIDKKSADAQIFVCHRLQSIAMQRLKSKLTRRQKIKLSLGFYPFNHK